MLIWCRVGLCVALCVPWIAGCNRSAGKPEKAIRLTTLKATVEGSAQQAEAPARTEWRFDKPPSALPEKAPATYGWEAASGISDLKIKDGKLVGRSTDTAPLIHFERTSGLESLDTIHSIEIRCRVSAGSNLRIGFDGAEKFSAADTIGYMTDFSETTMKTPILPGDEFQTYAIKPMQPRASNKIRHIALLPVDKAGASFEIESVRLIFRREYLGSIASGVSWQGLNGIYQETLVSRSPEQVKLSTKLPSRPWLDLSVGTVEEAPIQFRVAVLPSANGKEDVLLERTITRAHRWEPTPLDLKRYAGQQVTLSFSLISDKKGQLGFWGAPVIRNRESATKNSAARGVILWWADTLRRDHLDAYGYSRVTAPNIHQLASQGALFQNCVSQATWTKVSSPSLVTALYPVTHGVRDFTDRLPSSATTLAEALQNAGYATINFSSNEFTGTFSNFHQGFEQLHEAASLPDHHTAKTSRDYMDRLLPWLEAHRDVPFFVFFHGYDAHDPYEPYAPYDTMWADPEKKKAHEEDLVKARKVITDPLMKYFGMPDRNEMLKAGFDPETFTQYERDWYDGSIRGMDAEFGRMMEFLRTSGLDRKTLVVFAADHGEEFLEHGRMFHGQTVYGELTNVPLIFWKQGEIASNTVVKDTVETIDVMPTVLEFCGLKPPSGIQGQSFKDLISGEAPHGPEAGKRSSSPAISEKALTTGNDAPPPHDTESYSIVAGAWKLIHNVKRHPDQPEYELYDHETDVLNKTNVAAQHPEIVQSLSKQLDAWYAQASAARLKPDSQSSATLNQEELERMRSLGYIQ